MKLDSRRIDVADLSHRQITEMYGLFSRYFDRADRRRFDADLSEKDWVIQVLDPATGRLCGFSTQKLVHAPLRSEIVHALFSGDTIVDPAYWNETCLVREWGRLAVELIERLQPEPLYWLLISKGYKTYRFLPVFFREFYPRRNALTPRWAKERLDLLGQQLFADAYDPQRGLIVATHDKDRLRAGIADITPKRLADADVQYFVTRNPDHARGDELCCLAPLRVENFTAAGIRLLDPQHRPEDTAPRRQLIRIS